MEEPFKVGMSVIWHGGIEQGAFISAGTIVEVVGKPFEGTLVCEFGSKKERHSFRKSDGANVGYNGYIRLG